jgi:D-arginine dehydrogenase
VGFDPQAKGFFWLAGQGGYGVQSAPGMAQLARHLLLQTPLPLNYERLQESIEAVSPARLMT